MMKEFTGWNMVDADVSRQIDNAGAISCFHLGDADRCVRYERF